MVEGRVTREEVHEALSHLYDNDLLAQTTLAARLPETRETMPLEKRAERMRALLLEAIEVLRPSRRCGFGSSESRHYDVLCLRYVENMTVYRMTEELSLGRRQIHRDLLEAEARLAEILASRAQAGDIAPIPQGKDPLSDELLVLRSQPTQVELLALVQSALRLVEPLAEQHGARVTLHAAAPVSVVVDGAVLKQVLIQCLGCAIQAGSPEVTVSVDRHGGDAVIAISFRSHVPPGELAGLREAQRIALSQQIRCELRGAGGCAKVLLSLGGGESLSLLVVEDNPGAVELYRRYLAGSGWRVFSVSDPRFARGMAQELRPDVIILDIMMPAMDGWSVLESLLRSPDTAAIPVLICSVVDDIQLGKALGARAYLKKPVSRGDLLAALSQCLPSRQASCQPGSTRLR
ncbi:MAG: response regulator [Anaerolineae bacterium]